MLQEKSCFTCNFFDESSPNKKPHQAERFGFCRYDTPKVISDKGEASWPVVKQHDWCGKFLNGN